MKKYKRSLATREKILEAGFELWKQEPLIVSTRNVAKKAGCSHGSVSYHFPGGIEQAVLDYAVNEKKDSAVIVSLLLRGHPIVKDMSEEEREKHFLAVRSI